MKCPNCGGSSYDPRYYCQCHICNGTGEAYRKVDEWDNQTTSYAIGEIVLYHGIRHRVIDCGEQGRRLACVDNFPLGDPRNGTDEVEEVKSRSVLRREALQKGEPMPTFEKPEMPRCSLCNDTGVEGGKVLPPPMGMQPRSCQDAPEMPERIWVFLGGDGLLHQEGNNLVYPRSVLYVRDNLTLPKDNVREEINKLLDDKRSLHKNYALMALAKALGIALFPEGLEGRIE